MFIPRGVAEWHAGFASGPALESLSSLGIQPELESHCVCNTVFYSLVSACAACRNSPVLRWSSWSSSCSSTTIGRFPGRIPEDTVLPSWAFHNVTVKDIWDPADIPGEDQVCPPSTPAPAPTPASAPQPRPSKSPRRAKYPSKPSSAPSSAPCLAFSGSWAGYGRG
ncbi:hypothetical protein BC835DRAFT_998378 [Cytidiella melzeri]|nr:hypothetical protein BC835DRAFT_998378 [Cytidiella melzeri]